MGIVVRIRITGGRETLAKFRDLPKDASAALRDANVEISKDLAEKIATAATASSKQSALVAPGIKARRDRVPSVEVGGRRRVGRNKVPLEKILFGANFGATRLKQYRPHRGAGDDDYWFFSTVEANEADIVQQWESAVDEVLRKWGS